MLRLVFLVILLIAAYSLPAHAASRSYFAVMVTDRDGQPLSGQEVKASQADVKIPAIDMTTNENGVAQLGDLADGIWTVEACGQTVTAESADGPTGWLINVTCHRVLLPVINQ